MFLALFALFALVRVFVALFALFALFALSRFAFSRVYRFSRFSCPPGPFWRLSERAGLESGDRSSMNDGAKQRKKSDRLRCCVFEATKLIALLSVVIVILVAATPPKDSSSAMAPIGRPLYLCSILNILISEAFIRRPLLTLRKGHVDSRNVFS